MILRCHGATSAFSRRGRDDLPQTGKTESPSSDSVRLCSCWHTTRTTTFRFHGRNRHDTGAAWGSAVLIKGREDPYIVSSILSWLSELGHSKVIIQSDGEPASEIVMRMVQSKGAMMEHPPCEIIQQQSQRYSHQSNGGAQRMVQTIRNQIKAYKIQIEKNSGITITADSPLLTWLPRHAAWQYTRFHKRQDSTTTAYEKIRHMSYQSPILLVGEAVACRRPGALVNKLESAWLEGIWLGRDSKTDEHLIGTPNGMVRSRALKRRVERRRWDVDSPERNDLGSVETDTSHSRKTVESSK